MHIIGLDLPPLVEVHFSTQKRGGEAPRQLGTTTDGVTEVDIPDTMLANNGASYDYYIYAFVYLSDAEHGETIRQIIIPVKSRPKPADYDPPGDPDFAGQILEELSTKLTQPDTAKVGQIFRVQSINEDGTLTLEAADMPSGGSGGGAVDDVQINGTSIVENGVASIPKAGYNKIGVAGYCNEYGIYMVGDVLRLASAANVNDYRNTSIYGGMAVLWRQLDTAVKFAMCDGKGAEWTVDEQAAARARMGIGETELIYSNTLEETVNTFEVPLIEYGRYIIHMNAANNSEHKDSIVGDNTALCMLNTVNMNNPIAASCSKFLTLSTGSHTWAFEVLIDKNVVITPWSYSVDWNSYASASRPRINENKFGNPEKLIFALSVVDENNTFLQGTIVNIYKVGL